jgi:hypothetical protein
MAAERRLQWTAPAPPPETGSNGLAKYSDAMVAPDAATRAWKWSHVSGLDTSSGLELVQQAHRAVCQDHRPHSVAFLIAGTLGGLVQGLTSLPAGTSVANVTDPASICVIDLSVGTFRRLESITGR